MTSEDIKPSIIQEIKMKLLNFLELIDENSALDVIDNDTGVLLAFYDGRDAIPNELNSYEVVPKSVRVNGMCISVNVLKPEN